MSVRTNYCRNPRPTGAATGDGITGFGRYGPGGSETGVTMTTDAPLNTAVVRTNYVKDPRATDTTMWSTGGFGTGGAGTRTMISGAADGPTLPDGTKVTTYVRYEVTTARTGGNAIFGTMEFPLGVTDPAGSSYAIAVYVRVSSALSVAPRRDGGVSADIGAAVPLVANTWTRVGMVDTLAVDVAGARTGINIPESEAFPVGTKVDLTAAIYERGATTLGEHFDGATLTRDASGDRRYVHAFTGTANASPSTQALTLTPGAVTPNGTGFARRVVTAAKTSGSTGWQGRTPTYYAAVTGAAGDQVAVSMLQRYVGADLGKQTRLRAEFFNAAGTSLGISDGPATDLPNGQWAIVSHVAAAPADFAFVGWWTYQLSGPTSTQVIDAGAAIDCGDVLIEKADTVKPYFDGSLVPASGLTVNGWIGEPYDSASTQTSPDMVASLLTTSQPQRVQILVEDVPQEVAYEVVGVMDDGREWPLPGGSGVGNPEQIRLIDVRSPINVPIRYELRAAQASMRSNDVVVTWQAPGDASSRYLVSSLDGSVVIPIHTWFDNGAPIEPEMKTTQFNVQNRRRPALVMRAAGDGGGGYEWLLTEQSTELLRTVMRDHGGALVIRTDGAVRDLPASELICLLTAPSELLGDRWSTLRLWKITYVFMDDPEPSTIPTVWTWDDVDALLAGNTWDQVTEMFGAMTWDQVDAFDWGSL